MKDEGEKKERKKIARNSIATAFVNDETFTGGRGS